MYRASLWHPSRDHRARAHGDALPDQNVAQHSGARPQDDAVADCGVPLASVHRLTRCAQCYLKRSTGHNQGNATMCIYKYTYICIYIHTHIVLTPR